MTIHRAAIFRYEIPFTEPFRINSEQTIAVRTGLFLRLEADDGSFGIGEIAPLAGIHYETTEQALRILSALVPRLIGRAFEGIADVAVLINDLQTLLSQPPSVACGVEAALLHCLTFRLDSLADLFPREIDGIKPSKTVPINGLVAGSADTLNRQAASLMDEGYTCLKIKVGRLPILEEVNIVQQIRRTVGESVALRLDANRSWSLLEAREFAKGIANCDIEYIEEPLANALELGQFHHQTGLPLALDESLAAVSPANLVIPDGVVAVILKPAVFGGILRAIDFARAARKQGCYAVVSSAFETGITLSQYAGLATWLNVNLNLSPTAHGLDTYRRLQHDVIESPFFTREGIVDIVEVHKNSYNLHFDVLEPIDL